MFERFTDRARRIVVLAEEEARLLGHSEVGTEHLLLGLVHDGEGVAAKALESLSISLEDARNRTIEIVGRGDSTRSGHIPFTRRAKRALELSLREALQLGHNYIGTEHILLGLLREGEGVAFKVLAALGADAQTVRGQVISMLRGSEPAGHEPSRVGRSSVTFVEQPWLTAQRTTSQRSRAVLERALGEALAVGAAEIEPEHLLLALLGDDDLIRDAGVDPQDIRGRIRARDDRPSKD